MGADRRRVVEQRGEPCPRYGPHGARRTAHGVSAANVAVWPDPSSSATLSSAQGPVQVLNPTARPAAVVAVAAARPSSRTSRWSAGVPWARRMSPVS